MFGMVLNSEGSRCRFVGLSGYWWNITCYMLYWGCTFCYSFTAEIVNFSEFFQGLAIFLKMRWCQRITGNCI